MINTLFICNKYVTFTLRMKFEFRITKPIFIELTTTMRKGIITHIDLLSGKGFIEDENQQDISFYLSDTQSNLRTGILIEFEIALDDNGLFATNVQSLVLQEPLLAG